jgi:hypothetical protein
LLSTFFLFFPESQVFSEKFDDGLSISEGFLVAVVKLVEGILECLVS